MNSPRNQDIMEYFVQNQMEMVEYNTESIPYLVNELQYSEKLAVNQVDSEKNYIKYSQKSYTDTSILEFDNSSQLNQASLSSFSLNSTSFITPSSRSSSSSSNSVVSSSSLVSNSSIYSREENDFISKDYTLQDQQSNIPVFNKDELKILSRCLPHTKIKKIIKCSAAVNHMIGSEVPALLAIACELFVRDLTSFSWNFTKRANRRTVQVQDIKSVSSKDFRLRRLLCASKGQLKNILSENKSIRQNKMPIIDCYQKEVIYPQEMKIPVQNIQQAQANQMYYSKSQNYQQNIINKQTINRNVDNYFKVNQDLQKPYIIPSNQHIKHSIDQLNNNNINYYNNYNINNKF